VEGLVHISEMSWTRNVRHPKECLDKGDDVKVRILDVSRDNRRIALGLKQVNDDPWEQLEAHFTSGKQVEGTVFRILEKGVILQMEMDIEGIIPARDLSQAEKDSLLKELNPGDLLSVTVQELNADDKKVVLMPDFEVKMAAPKEEKVEESAADSDSQPDESAAVEAEVAAPAEETPAEEAAATVAEPEAGEADEAAAEAEVAEPAEEEQTKKTATKKKAATVKKTTAKKAAKADSGDDGEKAGAAKKKSAAKKKAAKDEAE
ncbi:MAG: S1 RNA-binding domain-containing protein, partial [Candidatus Marinimicrobia bacterium]|nr:S1 RNA-binding domain-containing protein [Candidatus Neomarinimicrobiota bacterium]